MRLKDLNYRRVATKFPRVAEEFFRSQGMQVEVIKLHGNIELAPRIGIADMIVDIVSSGRTLRRTTWLNWPILWTRLPVWSRTGSVSDEV